MAMNSGMRLPGQCPNPFLIQNGPQLQNEQELDIVEIPRPPKSAFDVDQDKGFVPVDVDSSFIDSELKPTSKDKSKVVANASNSNLERTFETVVLDDDDDEPEEMNNPLFAAAGLTGLPKKMVVNPLAAGIPADTRKKIDQVLERYRDRKRNHMEMDEENGNDTQEFTPANPSWRFSGSMQSDDDEEMCVNTVPSAVTAARKELTLDTPPYMFFRPENRQPKKIRQSTDKPVYLQGNSEMNKYWKNRYQLFSRFDEGIKLDEESWYSVTPENIAAHIAERCSTDGIIIDGFCGSGGNAIQFARKAAKVIAIDIDPVKIQNAKHNARIYGVEHKITFVIADFLTLAPALKGDVVFLSPPWGGPEYGRAPVFNLQTMIPMDGIKLFRLAEDISPNIAYYVPRNVDREQLAILSGPGGTVEIETNFCGGHVKALTAYYGHLVNKPQNPY